MATFSNRYILEPDIYKIIDLYHHSASQFQLFLWDSQSMHIGL